MKKWDFELENIKEIVIKLKSDLKKEYKYNKFINNVCSLLTVANSLEKFVAVIPNAMIYSRDITRIMNFLIQLSKLTDFQFIS